jgi:hypothetical protein
MDVIERLNDAAGSFLVSWGITAAAVTFVVFLDESGVI